LYAFEGEKEREKERKRDEGGKEREKERKREREMREGRKERKRGMREILDMTPVIDILVGNVGDEGIVRICIREEGAD